MSPRPLLLKASTPLAAFCLLLLTDSCKPSSPRSQRKRAAVCDFEGESNRYHSTNRQTSERDRSKNTQQDSIPHSPVNYSHRQSLNQLDYSSRPFPTLSTSRAALKTCDRCPVLSVYYLQLLSISSAEAIQVCCVSIQPKHVPLLNSSAATRAGLPH